MQLSDSSPFVVQIVGRDVDVLALPDASVRAMLSRGLTHYFGSEAASKLKAFADRFTEENAGAVLGDDEKAAQKAVIVGEMLDKLLAGTVGTRAVGITVDPVEKVKARLARASVEATLRANGLKVPKKDEAVVFANGTSKTMEEMIATRLAATNKATGKVYGDEFQKEAEKIVKDQQKKKAEAEANAVSDGEKTADALGL